MFDRDKAVVYSTDPTEANELTQLAWSHGCVVLETITDPPNERMKDLLDYIRYDKVQRLYIPDVFVFSTDNNNNVKVLEALRRHNIQVYFPDWYLDPEYATLDAVIHVIMDSAKARIRINKVMISKGRRAGRRSPKKRRLPMSQICELRQQGKSWQAIAKAVNVPYTTIYYRRDDILLAMDMRGMLNQPEKAEELIKEMEE